jgi:hypothetical protein
MAGRSRHVALSRATLAAGLLLLPACGGDIKLELYSHEPGNFRVLAAGKAEQSQKSVRSPAGQLSMNSVESVDKNQIRRIVVYTDLPQPMLESNDPNSLLDSGVKAMSGKGDWNVQSQDTISLDGHPGRYIRFAITSSSAS